MTTEVKKYTFVWAVENFDFAPPDCSDVVSPCFKVRMMDNTNWILKYSRGSRARDTFFVDLCRDPNDSGPDEVEIKMRVFLLASDGSSAFNQTTDKNECALFEKGGMNFLSFVLKEDFLRRLRASNILTICCQIWKTSSDQLTSAHSSDKTTKYLECSDKVLKSMYKEISKESSIGKLCHLHPTKFFARTKIEIEKIFFTHQIIDFSNLPSPWITSFVPECDNDKNPQLLLNLNLDKDHRNVDIEIRPLLQEIKKYFWVKCTVKVVPTMGSPVCMMNDSHLFNPTEPLVWKTSFENSNFVIDKSIYLSNDILTLQFELVISNGRESSSIEEICYTVPFDSDRKKKTPTIMDDLLQFYEKQKYCDVKLQVGNETVEAHRAVLCSRSPVFREMFESEIPDNKIVITDVDMATLKCMLLFMYTENIESLKLENVFKLYTVADKHKYEVLRKECSLCLSSNIQLSNVCEVLLLANHFGDDELKTASLDYLRLHANEVFGLKEWKSFVRNNILLASEAIGYVSSVVKKSYIERKFM